MEGHGSFPVRFTSGEPLAIFHVALKNNHVQSAIHHTGFFKKTAIDQKVPTCTGSPRTPCINVATYHFSMAGARMAVFF